RRKPLSSPSRCAESSSRASSHDPTSTSISPLNAVSHLDASPGRNDSALHDPAPMAVSERELLEKAKAGDLQAFAEFVGAFERRTRAVPHRRPDDARDADEAVQDTFVQAWQSLERFRGDAAPYPWLYRIAVNEALMRRRRKTLPTSELHETTGSG